MEHFAGLDVSVNKTSVCIVDETGRMVREAKVASEPEALLQVLKSGGYRFKCIGLESGPLSQWLYSAFAEAGLPAICVETRHMRAVLKAQINKTDRNDARGIAQMMRAGPRTKKQAAGLRRSRKSFGLCVTGIPGKYEPALFCPTQCVICRNRFPRGDDDGWPDANRKSTTVVDYRAYSFCKRSVRKK